MSSQSTICIQLSELWGDESDSLNHDVSFIDGLAKSMMHAEVTIVMPTQDRATKARARLQDLGAVHVIARDDLDLQSIDAHEVIVGCMESRTADLAAVDRKLRGLGYRRAGRAWGEAGQTRRYVLPGNMNERWGAFLQEMRVRAGGLTVHLRDRWFASDRIKARAERARFYLRMGPDPKDLLDDNFGIPLDPMPRIDVRDVFPAGMRPDATPWSLQPFDGGAPAQLAEACFNQHGIWPISFSLPGEPLPIDAHPEVLIAPIIPGLPYSFTNARTYLETYQHAYLGLTHRKAGWDCFRHVEILGAGGVPVMPDASNIPAFSMVHYPKQAMADTVRKVSEMGSPPANETREAFRSWLNQHLTSRAMATYLLTRANLAEDSRVLFVDEQLPHTADYLSVLTYIGLKQVLGTHCEALFPIDYVFQNSQREESTLYGRGFGYSRILPEQLRTDREQRNSGTPTLMDSYDAIIVGSISRNHGIARSLLTEVPRQRTVWIHGEDTPPTAQEAREWRATGAHLFVRAIHTAPRGRV